MNVLKINNIGYSHHHKAILNNINITVNKGDFLGIIGPNGGGKTTLVKILLGLIKPTKGYFDYTTNLNIGYVPQKESFLRGFPIDVLDTVLMGSLPSKIQPFKYSVSLKNKCLNLLNDLNLFKLKSKNISSLSGGELQKVLIARALLSKPDILILDEPTANIDFYTENEIFKLLDNLQNKMTIIAVSHNINKLIEHANSFAVINCNLLYSGQDKQMLKQSVTNFFRI